MLIGPFCEQLFNLVVTKQYIWIQKYCQNHQLGETSDAFAQVRKIQQY